MHGNLTNSQSFRPVLKLAGLLSDFKELWFVAGGWAIDLYVQQGRRKHKDLDIAVFREDQLVIQGYLLDSGWKLWKYIGDSQGVEPWLPGQKLELPDRGIYAQPVNTEIGSVDILLSEKKGERWYYHRDARITHAIQTVGIRSDLDIPFLSPEIVLLFKAHHLYTNDSSSMLHRQTDEDDFQSVHRLLTARCRTWLEKAIGLLYPNHPWLKYLR
jgi:hypothetical protein